MTSADLLRFVLLGAVLGLDVVSFPQAMYSRPLVSATLAGLMVGQGASGLLVGIALELVALDARPFGAAHYPDWGCAGVVAGAIFTLHADEPSAALCVSVLAGLVTGWAGGLTMVAIRHRNGTLRRRYQPAIDAGSGRALAILQGLGLATDFARAALLTLVALLVLVPLSDVALANWGADLPLSRAVLVAVTATIGVASVWQLVQSGRSTKLLFVAGIAAGFLYFARG